MSGRFRLIAPGLEGTAALILLAACAELESAIEDVGGDTRTLAYDCDDEREFAAEFSADRDNVRVRTANDAYDLELADRDGDQRVYRDDDDEVTLVVDEDRAELEIEDEDDFEDCELERS